MLTLKDLPTASKQDVFNQVVAHARKQKVRAVNNNNTNTCVFRSPDGLKCFLGCLISDDEYMEEMEGLWFDDVLSLAGVETGVNDIDKLSFYRRLQRIHDCREVEDWESQFKEFAQRYNLTYTEPK
jgi:hypothetical protein